MVRLVLFDVDGTLVHTGRAGTQAFAKTLATEFNAPNGVEKISFAGRTDVNLVREFFGIHGIPATPGNFARFFERYVFWLDQMVARSHGGPCRGVPEMLDGLRALPRPPALAEAKVESFLDNFREPQWGHSEFFQSVERTRISLSRPHFSQWNS